jgi:adenine-specific DNA-methyltransferase
MDKLKLHTPDFTAANIEKLAALFPGCVTEARDEKGVAMRGIDFDQLRQELSDHIVEGPRERYHLDWPGKREALLAANAPIAKTLRPCREESVDFDTTKNLFIEGDNLDALKLLQETYLGKVKMIYIDPPYNTGTDFLYDDNFSGDTDAFLIKSNQKDEVGNRMVTNNESNGRFHSDWLSMMYARLSLARNLLREDGVIFVSIGEEELANLTNLLNKVFGEQNRLAIISRLQKRGGNKGNFFNPVMDYILAYARNVVELPFFTETVDEAIYNKVETEGPKKGQKYAEVVIYMPNLDYRPNQRFYVDAPDGSKVIPPEGKSFRWSRQRFEEELRQGNVAIKPARNSKLIDEHGNQSKWIVYQKRFLTATLTDETARPNNFLEDFQNMLGSKELQELGIPFDYPKPSALIRKLLFICKCRDEDLVLDLFAGSASTAQAVLDRNQEDGGRRKFIMVQLPEACDPNSEAYKAGYKVISDIGKERIRRVGARIKEKNSINSADFDVGFRVLKIDTSNMADVYYAPDAVKQTDLVAHTDNIKPERTPEDLLFQVLVDWGVDLSLSIAQETVAKKKVFFVDGNALAACFDPKVSEDLVKELAKRKPLRVVFRDSSYDSDSVKINVEQIFKLLSPETEVKSL